MTFIRTLLPFFLIASVSAQPFPVFTGNMRSVKQISLPAGYEREAVTANSFGEYLRNLPLRKDKTVYLYNKQPKSNQSLHYAVIDISTGDKDLQQCADAIMRLRAEYFFGNKQYDSIRFAKGDRSVYRYSSMIKKDLQGDHEQFMHFMQTVFIYCGTYSLEQELKSVRDFSSLKIGDVLIRGGAPGHAEIIVDVAINKLSGKKIYLLAEGYMPAQDIHILLNPVNPNFGPWYELDAGKEVQTATWIFQKSQLKRW